MSKSSRCCLEKTEPQGLLGLLITMATTVLSTKLSRWSRSISQFFSGWRGRGRRRGGEGRVMREGKAF